MSDRAKWINKVVTNRDRVFEVGKLNRQHGVVSRIYKNNNQFTVYIGARGGEKRIPLWDKDINDWE